MNDPEEDGHEPVGEWEEFDDEDRDPIRVEEFKRLDLQHVPAGIQVSIMDDYFPETTIWREDEIIVCEIQEAEFA